jgi:hypothetical protein
VLVSNTAVLTESGGESTAGIRSLMCTCAAFIVTEVTAMRSCHAYAYAADSKQSVRS